jgi:hypothetical protein
MEQYIPKAAVVAEIERLKNTSLEYGYNTMQKILADSGKDLALEQLRYFLSTLEVIEIGVDIGSPEGDIGVKTIWHGDKIVSNKEQKGE